MDKPATIGTHAWPIFVGLACLVQDLAKDEAAADAADRLAAPG
jgi:hypothetical protein